MSIHLGKHAERVPGSCPAGTPTCPREVTGERVEVYRLMRNLPDWSRFEKAAIEHRVIPSAYAEGAEGIRQADRVGYRVR